MGHLPAVVAAPRSHALAARPIASTSATAQPPCLPPSITLDGVVLGRCMQKHTHQEFIRFLNAVERAVPAGKLIHAIVDNYATTSTPRSKPGSSAIRAGPSISPRPPAPGSTRSKISSPL